MQKFQKCFISLILSYKARKKKAFLRCTSNQAGIGHTLHFQPKNPGRAKLAAINNKNGCGTAEVWWIQFRKYFISFILSYKVRKKTALLCCTANQAGTGHKLHFQPKNPARAKLAPINNKNGCGRAEVWWRQFRKYLISLILSYKVRKNTALIRCTSNQAGTDHKLHFQPQKSS